MDEQDIIKELMEKLSDLSHACTQQGLDIPEMWVSDTLDKARRELESDKMCGCMDDDILK